jgi:xanthine/uracil permease
MFIAAVILVLGLGISGGIPVNFGSTSYNLSPMFIAALVGIILNKVLPEKS